MSHIDTLEAFDNLKASGMNEITARAQVKVIDKAFDGLDAVRKAELDYALDYALAGIKVDIGVLATTIKLLKKDFFGLKWMVIGIGVVFAVPIFEKIILFLRG